ncbi:MAG: hypothetical protein HC819_12365 [Cyclobacteriaceae bacterium]|nr:hypothetical protein [Cyclobacteriaceae bacterium]
MKPNKQRTGVIVRKPALDRIERIHPQKMLIYMIISISCLIYAVISYFFIKHLAANFENAGLPFQLPRFFTISTLILTVSGLFTSRLIRAYQHDEITNLRKQLGYLLISGLLFFISQSVAWIEMLNNEFIVETESIAGYLLIFTGTHFAFMFAAIIMTAILFYKYMFIENDPVKTLIVVTNPHEKIRLEIFTSYWNFTLLSWDMVFLMLLFVF